MARNYEFPIVIQCSQSDAECAVSAFMAQVFDLSSYLSITAALSKQYLHVVAWDNTAEKVFEYDNR